MLVEVKRHEHEHEREHDINNGVENNMMNRLVKTVMNETQLSESNAKHEMAARILKALESGEMTGAKLSKSLNAIKSDATFDTYKRALELCIGRKQIERVDSGRGFSYRLAIHCATESRGAVLAVNDENQVYTLTGSAGFGARWGLVLVRNTYVLIKAKHIRLGVLKCAGSDRVYEHPTTGAGEHVVSESQLLQFIALCREAGYLGASEEPDVLL